MTAQRHTGRWSDALETGSLSEYSRRSASEVMTNTIIIRETAHCRVSARSGPRGQLVIVAEYRDRDACGEPRWTEAARDSIDGDEHRDFWDDGPIGPQALVLALLGVTICTAHTSSSGVTVLTYSADGPVIARDETSDDMARRTADGPAIWIENALP